VTTFAGETFFCYVQANARPLTADFVVSAVAALIELQLSLVTWCWFVEHSLRTVTFWKCDEFTFKALS
jgi:hypothetical protein